MQHVACNMQPNVEIRLYMAIHLSRWQLKIADHTALPALSPSLYLLLFSTSNVQFLFGALLSACAFTRHAKEILFCCCDCVKGVKLLWISMRQCCNLLANMDYVYSWLAVGVVAIIVAAQSTQSYSNLHTSAVAFQQWIASESWLAIAVRFAAWNRQTHTHSHSHICFGLSD